MVTPWIIESVARIGDMDPKRALRIRLMRDGDISITIEDGDGIPIGGAIEPNAVIEFCTPGGGRGRSEKTRIALYELLKAIKEDNEARPDVNPDERRRKGAS